MSNPDKLPTTCPHCGENLQGPEIPDNRRDAHNGATHYSNRLAMYDRELGRTTHFECPKCRGRVEV